MENIGLIHIYCGDGKGKTTAAAGLAARAAGNGIPVLFVQFLKDGTSGEIKVLDKTEGIEVLCVREHFGFLYQMSEQQKVQAAKEYSRLFKEAVCKCSGSMILVLDELMSAYRYGLLDRQEVMEFLKQKPPGLEIIMTGRDPSPELCDAADYITEMKNRKHPFDRGIPARKGIEF